MLATNPQPTPTSRSGRSRRSGRLQIRITALIVVILVPILAIFTWFDIRSQQQKYEELILDKAQARNASGRRCSRLMHEDSVSPFLSFRKQEKTI